MRLPQIATALCGHDGIAPLLSTNERKARDQPPRTSKSDLIRELLKADKKPSTIAKQVGYTPALAYNARVVAGGGMRKRAKANRSTAPGSTSQVDDITITAILNAVKAADEDRVKMGKALERIQ